MKTLSTPFTNAATGAVQRPAMLVEIGFATPKRYTSAATLTWNSLSWTAEDIRLAGLNVEALRISGTLSIQNLDGVIGGLILGEGIQDKTVKVYNYDAAATALADVQLIADAVASSATINENVVTINLRHKCEFTLSPRTLVNVGSGFTYKLSPGVVLKINGIDYKLERR